MPNTALFGILITCLSYALFSMQDASVKWLVAGLPVWQVLLIRSVTIFALCLAVGRRPLMYRALHSPVFKPLFIRNVLLLAAWLAFYTAARDLGLAQLTTLYYAAPIIMTLLSIPVLGEEVPLNRWVALLIGFAGVVIASNIIGAGLDLSLPVGLALLAALFWAIANVLLRKTALSETSLTQMTISNGFFVVFLAPLVPFAWVPAPWPDLALMAVTGIIAGAAQFALFEGMRRAPISMLAPFEYTSLIWAFILGFLIWGEVPAAHVILGAVLIFSAGLVIIASERMRRPRAAAKI